MKRQPRREKTTTGPGGEASPPELIRVLHVDDNAYDRALVRDALEREQAGFQVIEAASRQEFEHCLSQVEFDVVLTDYNILGYKGLNVIEAIRLHKPDVPVVVMTGTGNEEVAVVALKLGAADYVLKSPTRIRKLPVTIRDVVARRRMQAELLRVEEDLRANEEKFRILWETTTDTIIMLDDNNIIQFVNSAVKKMFGYLPEEIVGQDMAILEPESLREKHRRGLMHYFETGERTVNWGGRESLGMHRNGRIFPVEIAYTDISLSGKRLLGGFIRDITDRKQAEVELQRYAEIVATTTDLLAFRDVNNRFVVVNDEYCKYFNLPREKVLGRTLSELLGRDQLEDDIGDYSHRCLRGETFQVESWLDYPGAGRRYMDMHYHPYKDDSGRVVGMVVSARDITDRKQAEVKLQQTNEKLSAIVNASPVAICMLDPDAKVLMWNPAAERLLGWRAEELLGKPYLVASETERANFPAVLEQAAKGIIAVGQEQRRRRKDGTEVEYALWTTPLLDAEGRPYAGLGMMADISDRKRAERNLQVRLEQQAAVARFTSDAVVAHNADAIMQEAVEVAAQTLSVEYCKVLEPVPGRNQLVMRAGVGWREGLVGQAVVDAGADSQAGYTLQAFEPVIVEDLRTESRFRGSELLSSHGVVSGLSVMIGSSDRPLGVLGAHTRNQRLFTRDDAAFLEAIANALAGALIRIRTEQRLMASERRFSHLLNSSPSVIYASSTGATHECRFVNETLEYVTGYRPEQMTSDPRFWISHVHVDDVARVLIEIKDGLAKGSGSIEYRFRHANGSYRWIRDTFRVSPEPGGGSGELIGAWTDITERIEMERARQESEERFRIVAETSSDLIYEWQFATGEVRWYGDIDTALGYGPNGFSRTRAAWAASLHPDDQARVKQAIETHLRDPTVRFSAEYRIGTSGGSYRDWLDRGMVVQHEGGRAEKWIGACTDITDARLMEERLTQSQKMEAVGQLTGGVAHDFNNRLTVILGNLELLQRRLEDDPRGRKLLDAALKAADGGAQLTRQLLAFARRQMLEAEVLNPNEVVRGVMALLEQTLGEHVELDLALEEGAWPVKTDRSLLENALLNLAVNARDAMPAGGKLTVETRNVVLDAAYIAGHRYARPGDHVLLAVSDTGAGMPESIRKRAFEPFFTTKEAGRGTGLGLSMVYGFMKQSGGHAEIYSEQGHGTTMKLYFPKAEGESPAAARKAAALLETSLIGRRVLVVEDDAGVRQLAVSHLGELGYDVREAENGPAALVLAEGLDHLDLLFTDMIMPGGVTGTEVAKRLQARWPNLNVLFTSGYAEQAALNQGLESGPRNHWLAKPYRPADLAALIGKILKGT